MSTGYSQQRYQNFLVSFKDITENEEANELFEEWKNENGLTNFETYRVCDELFDLWEDFLIYIEYGNQ